MAKTAGKYIQTLGNKIGAKELRQIEQKFGSAGVEKAKSYAQSKPNVAFTPGASTQYRAITSTDASRRGIDQFGDNTGEGTYVFPRTDNTSAGGVNTSGEGTVSDAVSQGPTLTSPEMDTATRIALQNILKDTETEKQKLYNEGWAKAQGISADATRYVSDREKEAILGKTEIETRGRIDLQGIINAGLKDVAGIEAQSARDVATIGGEFGVKQEQTRQTGQKDIARIGARAGILQGLVGAFNF
jgi:hypothetical protein